MSSNFSRTFNLSRILYSHEWCRWIDLSNAIIFTMSHMASLHGALSVSFIRYPSSMVSLGSLPISFKLGYSFALSPSLLILPWKSGFLSFGALRCSQISRRLLDMAILPLCICLVRGIDTLAGGDIGESVVALITLTLAVASSLPKL